MVRAGEVGGYLTLYLDIVVLIIDDVYFLALAR